MSEYIVSSKRYHQYITEIHGKSRSISNEKKQIIKKYPK